VVGQTAASVLLLVLAGLLVRGLHRSASIDPGFEPEGVHLLSLDLSHNLYSEADGRVFYDALLRRVAALPGVAGVGLANRVPLGTEYSSTGVNVAGVAPPEGDDSHTAGQSSLGGDYFRTMGIPLLAGRGFDARDGSGAPAVAVVSEAFARRFWPDGDEVGRTFYEGTVGTGEAIQVVGVAGQVKYRSVGEESRLYVYRPVEQRYRDAMTLHVRIEGEPGPVLQGVRDAVRDLDDAVPVVAAMPLSRYIRVATFPQRLAAGLTGFLGLVGLLLVGVGIYGLVAYSVAQRRLEIGVRMAMGARPAQVTGLVLRQGLVLALSGAAVGFALSLVAGQALSAFLFGLSATDPVTYAAVAAVLVAGSLLASYLPARSAARLDAARTLQRA
jgi:putative ABC transport system permease protein